MIRHPHYQRFGVYTLSTPGWFYQSIQAILSPAFRSTQFWSHVSKTPTRNEVTCMARQTTINISLLSMALCKMQTPLPSVALQGLREDPWGVPQKGEVTTVAVENPFGAHCFAMANTGWRLGLSHCTIQAKDAKPKHTTVNPGSRTPKFHGVLTGC